MSERMSDDDVLYIALRLGMGKVTKEQVLAFADAIARAAEAEQAAEIARLTADTAATLRALQAILDRTRIISADMGGKHRYSLDGSREASEAVHAGLCLSGQPHPGSALLEDLKRKEEQVKELGAALHEVQVYVPMFKRAAMKAAFRLAGVLK